MSKLIPNKYNGEGFDGRRTYYKGGGGSSGQRKATPEEKRLWAAQANSLEQMTALSMPRLQTGMHNLGVLANESMDDTLATRLRGMASADALQAGSMGLQDAGRQLSRFGATMNPNALAAQTNMAGLDMARMRTNAMNLANMGAEDVRWQRNAALTGLASGQGAQAVSGMGSLAQQIGQDRMNSNNAMMQNQASNTQGLMGLGMAGAYMMKADGGEVRLRDGGGGLRLYEPVSMPTLAPWKFKGSAQKAAPDGGAMQTVASAVGPAIGTRMMANGLDKLGISAPKQTIDGLGTELVEAGKSFINGTPMSGTVVGQEGLKSSFSGDGGSWATAQLADDAALANLPTTGQAATVGAEALTADAALQAGLTNTAGTVAGGSALGSAAMAAAPWLIGGYALGSMLDLWADGGTVPKKGLTRKDVTEGGDVQGAGTETSDSIPARLSDGEYVLNADAVKLIGKQKLDALNNAGLRKRYGENAPQSEAYVQEAGEQKFALGGLAALGHMARGFVPTAVDLDERKKQDARYAKQDARLDAAETRNQGLYDREAQRDLEQQQTRKSVSEILAQEAAALSDIANRKAGDGVSSLVRNYNAQAPGMNDMQLMSFKGFDANGNGVIERFESFESAQKGAGARSTYKPEEMQALVRQATAARLAAADPEGRYLGAYFNNRKLSQGDEQLAQMGTHQQWQRGHGDATLAHTKDIDGRRLSLLGQQVGLQRDARNWDRAPDNPRNQLLLAQANAARQAHFNHLRAMERPDTGNPVVVKDGETHLMPGGDALTRDPNTGALNSVLHPAAAAKMLKTLESGRAMTEAQRKEAEAAAAVDAAIRRKLLMANSTHQAQLQYSYPLGAH